MITVPQDFAADTITREGEAGRRWIDELPGLVESLCAQWGLVVDGPVMHGYLGLVVPVQRGNEPCVLKLSWIDASSQEEATALAAWDGRGAVRLLEIQPALGAMLLERLDFTRSLSRVAVGEAIAIAGRLMRRLAIPPPAGLRPLQAVAAELAQNLPQHWEALGRPLPEPLLARACDLARQLGPRAGGLLVNHDLHYENVLAGGREPWLAVDPKVVVGDVEYGVAQLLWCRLEEIEAQGGLDLHFRLLTETAALDPELARAWTLVRCVDYWLWGLRVGLTEDPVRCERITRWLAWPSGA